jgi:hypothetical protein
VECGDMHQVLKTPGYKAVLHQTRLALTTTFYGVHALEYRYRHAESLELRRFHPSLTDTSGTSAVRGKSHRCRVVKALPRKTKEAHTDLKGVNRLHVLQGKIGFIQLLVTLMHLSFPRQIHKRKAMCGRISAFNIQAWIILKGQYSVPIWHTRKYAWTSNLCQTPTVLREVGNYFFFYLVTKGNIITHTISLKGARVGTLKVGDNFDFDLVSLRSFLYLFYFIPLALTQREGV